MGATWTPEAERLTPRGTPGTMSGVGGPRATLHCTVSLPGSFDAMHRVLIAGAKEPHYLYDPKTDRLGQYFPLDRSARALMGSPDVSPSHNKAGEVNIQVEICAMPNDWTAGWTPGPKFRAMMRDIASHGIRPQFVFRLPRNGTAAERDAVARPASVIYGAAGGGLWWGHCHYKRPEIHWDPGPINEARFFAAAPNQEDDMADPATIKAVYDAVMNTDDIPSPFGESNPTVTARGALQWMMQWSLAARNAAQAGAKDAAVARAIAEASAQTDGPLSEADVQRIAEATAREVGEGFTVEGQIVPKAQP